MKAVLGVLAVLSLTATAAKAADDIKVLTDRDLRCIVVMSVANSQAAEARKAAIGATISYYFGRIEAREPDVKIEARLRETLRSGLRDIVLRDSQRCNDEALAMGERIKGVGKAFTP